MLMAVDRELSIFRSVKVPFSDFFLLQDSVWKNFTTLRLRDSVPSLVC